MAQNWQFDQVCGAWFNSVPNQKHSRFHLCLLHFLSLTSSLQNWNWQGNYHFILNWSQSMWAGSKHRDTKEGKRDMEEKKKGAFWEHLAMVQSSVRRIAWRVGRDGSEGEKGRGDVLEIALRVFPWCPPDRNQIGRRAASALWLFICLAPPGFSWPE